MGGRRPQLLDTGVELIAQHGLEDLTHEAVDTAAHVPAGSTQRRFPTRRALVEGVTQRCIERELDMTTGPGAGIEASIAGVADAFGHFVLRANYVTGLVFHELALPTPDLDATGRVRDLIDTLGWRTP